MYFLWYLLIGLVAGWLANLIVKGSGWIPVGTLGSLLTSIAGAVILLWIVSLINHKKNA